MKNYLENIDYPFETGYDVIAQAQSGTGKTATFSTAVLQRIDTQLGQCQALILAPSRELAQQSYRHVLALGDYMQAEVVSLVGGKTVSDDVRRIRGGKIHVVVGTPGRVYHMINQGILGKIPSSVT